MPTQVSATQRAQQQINALTGPAKRSFDAFLDDLAQRGCAALAYRLSGPVPVDHVCVKHLYASLRVAVVFEAADSALIMLVGPHDDNDTTLNIYSELYRVLGVTPGDEAGRTKPPCCDATDQSPPILGDEVDVILESASRARRERRRRSGRR